jgi:peptidyl-prolyl cis-trans isomerase C
MKAFSLVVLICASSVWAQTPPTGYVDKPETVIATLDDGTKITAGELDALIPQLPKLYRDAAETDPQKFLNLLALFKQVAVRADAEKLTDQAPYKQGLDFAEMEAKARMWVQKQQTEIAVSDAEIETYYNAHKEPFRRFKVSGIKVAFGGTPPEAGSSSPNSSRVPRNVLTEEDAKAKAETLVAKIRAGADFFKLVQTDSDDETSKAKNGDLGTWSMTDNVPDALRGAVLSLKKGEVSDPIKQPGGYYIVHADDVTYTPLSDLKDQIFAQLKEDKAQKFLKDLYNGVHVQMAIPAAPMDPKK